MSTETNPRIGELPRTWTRRDGLACVSAIYTALSVMSIWSICIPKRRKRIIIRCLRKLKNETMHRTCNPIALLSPCDDVAGRRNRHPEDLELNIKALAILENTDPSVRNNELYASIFGNIGLHYRGLAGFAHAREFFLRALNYYEIMGDRRR